MTRTELENQTPAASRLRISWALAAAGGLLLGVGPLLGVVDGAEPAYTSWPLLALLALLPPVVAGVLLMRGRPFVAAGLIAAVGVFAFGRLLSDLQIAFDPMAVARPELFRPTTLIAVTPSAGLWVLIAGHVLTIAGGLMSAGRAGMPADESEPPGLVAMHVITAFWAAVGLLGKPFTSTDAYQLDRGPWELPVLGLTGGLLLALAAPLATALAASSPDPDTRQGGVLGVSLAVAGTVLPWLVAGTVATGLSISAGPVIALIAALTLPVLPLLARLVRLLLGKRDETKDLALPSLRRMHVAAGVFTVLSAVAMLGGALLPQLVLTTGGKAPDLVSANLLWPAGLAFGVLGLALVVPSTAAAVRPALLFGHLAMQLAAAGATEPVLAASQAGIAQPGAGFWLMVAEIPLGLLALVCAGLAGAVERENTEIGKRQEVPVAELGAVLLAGLFAAGAFALPTVRGDNYTAATLMPDSDPVVSASLISSLVVLIIGLVVALRSRPARGAAVLAGGVLLMGVRALELPLTGEKVVGAVAGPGTWLALASAAALLVAAALMGARATR
ncbi:hypothetical protein [Lentzea flava]|uniref:Uncharacterized protein n=1 Tax=Lentzea flava TaxID=103732 RepID=A0ABQ2VH59_9PSEU|nr:hypothetical protein [Lentzea flava]MCP2205440.1 hypothetical protein [Lentzea flava]GGU86840.1 hypothetical protein GCM10010178_90940 [Lentzea flava]